MSQSSKVFSQDLSLSLHNLVCALDRPEFCTVESLLNQFVGNNNAGAMLRRLIYWFPKAKKFGGWVYKSWRDWGAEINLSQGQVKRVLKNGYLEAIGIERELKKANGAPTNHYRLNPEIFIRALADFLGETVERVRELMEKDHRRKQEASKKQPARQSSAGQTGRKNPYAGMTWSDFAENSSEQPNPKGANDPFHLNNATQSNGSQTTQSITNHYTQTSIYRPKTTKEADLFSFLKK
ncbi:MAG: hypothetical protein Phog2KO_47800 [Phototrophicaceae bacterium]